MKIKQITWQHRNDYKAIMECEHCGHEEEDANGYNDQRYHELVIPRGHYCADCGKNRAGEVRKPLSPSAAWPFPEKKSKPEPIPEALGSNDPTNPE